MKNILLPCFIGYLSFSSVGFTEEPYPLQKKLQPCIATISSSHIEGRGIGYTEGYTTLEGLLFPFTSQETVFPLLDLRGHVFNNGESAANAGIGLRIAPTTLDTPNVLGTVPSMHRNTQFLFPS